MSLLPKPWAPSQVQTEPRGHRLLPGHSAPPITRIGDCHPHWAIQVRRVRRSHADGGLFACPRGGEGGAETKRGRESDGLHPQPEGGLDLEQSLIMRPNGEQDPERGVLGCWGWGLHSFLLSKTQRMKSIVPLGVWSADWEVKATFCGDDRGPSGCERAERLSPRSCGSGSRRTPSLAVGTRGARR